MKFALIDDMLHAQPDRRIALEKRGMQMIAIDLAGKVAATGLENFADLIKDQSDVEPEIDIADRDLATARERMRDWRERAARSI